MDQVTISRELLRQVLYVIDAWERDCDHEDYWRDRDDSIKELRAALEQPSVEPVAWAGYDLDGMVEAFNRVIENHAHRNSPFHNPIDADARMALRILRGIVPAMKRYTAPQAQQPDTSCKFPMCQTEQYQQMLAKQVARDLFGIEQPQLLTDEEINDILEEWVGDFEDYARAVEQASLRKNGVIT